MVPPDQEREREKEKKSVVFSFCFALLYFQKIRALKTNTLDRATVMLYAHTNSFKSKSRK